MPVTCDYTYYTLLAAAFTRETAFNFKKKKKKGEEKKIKSFIQTNVIPISKNLG